MLPDYLCLQSMYKTFLNFMSEMELSLMFPSILKDISLSQLHNLNMFSGNVNDCSDLFQELLAIKEEFTVGMKRNWYGNTLTDQNNNERDITSKFNCSLEFLLTATKLAKLLRIRYNTILNETLQDNSSLEQNEMLPQTDRVVENQNFNDILDKFLEEIKELENIILIPSILNGQYDPEVTSYIKKYKIGINDASLFEILDFLKSVRDDLTEAPSKKQFSTPINTFQISDLTEFHSNLSDLLKICSWLMQKYQNELHLKAGTDIDVWTGSYDTLNTGNMFAIKRNSPTQRLEFSF